MQTPLFALVPHHIRRPARGRRFQRALGLVAAFLVAGIGISATPVSAADGTLSADLRERFGRATSAPCPEGAFWCGSGTLAGYGPVTSAFYLQTPGEYDATSGCFTGFVGFEQLTLASGEHVLTLEETGTMCYPSPGAGNAPGAARSFGNPTTFVGAYTIFTDFNSGVFVGATGSGTVKVRLAGNTGRGVLTGSLVLAG